LRRSPLKRGFIAVLLSVFTLAACGGDGNDQAGTGGTGGGSAEAEQAIEQTVRDSFEAENARDVRAFAALWTNEGLEQYDVGTREDLEAGRNPDFGREQVTIIDFAETEADGDEGSTTVDVISGASDVAKPVFRVRFAAIERDGRWLLNGFEFVGSPPAPEGTEILEIGAIDYAFVLDRKEVPGEVAFSFSNTGQEAHEIALFKGPDGTDIGTAKAALENLDGSELDNVPEGYRVDHVAFADARSNTDITFAEPLPAGDYFLVCYIPQGGFTEEGEPVNPEGTPHVQLGMINTFTVR